MEGVTGRTPKGSRRSAPVVPHGPEEPEPRRLRIFLLKVLLFAGAWGAIFFRGEWARYGIWMACSAALVGAGLLAPAAARGPRRLVLLLGSALGRALSFLALAVIYWSAVVPVALVARLSGKRFLAKGKDPAAATYWVPRGSGAADKASLERQF